MTMFRFLIAKQPNSFALFGGGVGTSGLLQSTEKYFIANDTKSTGSSYTGTARRGLIASSNNSVGFFRGGDNGSTFQKTSDKYTFANDGVASSTNLARAVYQPSAHSIQQTGIWFTGIGSTDDDSTNVGKFQNVSSAQKLDFSSETIASGISITARYTTCAIGDTIYAWICGGLIFGGGSGTVVERYRFSDDTTSTRTGLPDATNYSGASTGCSTFGVMYFYNGGTPRTKKYIFATETTSSVGTNVRTLGNPGAGSNAIAGIFAFGAPNPGSGASSVNTTSKYHWSSDVVSTGTSLTTARGETTGCGSNPGHL